MTLVLSLFPGADLLGYGFEREGFCVVAGPDIQFGRDIRDFSPPSGVFSGVIGGPPCQAFSRLAHMARYMGYQIADNMIPEFERVVSEAAPEWFLMENVPDAPEPIVSGYHVHSFLLNNRWLGETQNRLRRFSFGHVGELIDLRKWIELALFESMDYHPTVLAAGSREYQIRFNSDGKPKKKLAKVRGNSRSVDDYARLQGLPDDFFADSSLTIAGKLRLLGNGVPVPMARAVAAAIREAIECR